MLTTTTAVVIALLGATPVSPDVPPPAQVAKTLKDVAAKAEKPLALGYCPNAGLPEVRAVLATRVSEEQQTMIESSHIVVTSGAAGALNTILRTILSPGDEVVCIAPYFVEYKFYANNFGGNLCAVPAKPDTFEIDIAALETAINPRTRAMMLPFAQS